MGERTFQAFLNRIAEQIDLPGLNVNRLRATGIVRHLEAGLDPRVIQKYMGVRALKSITKYSALAQPSVVVGMLAVEPANDTNRIAVGL